MKLKAMDLPISVKGMILVTVPTLMATIFLLVLGFMLYESQQEASREARTKEILIELQRIGVSASEATTAILGQISTRRRSLTVPAKAMKANSFIFKHLERLIAKDKTLVHYERQWYYTAKRLTRLAFVIHQSMLADIDFTLLHDKSVWTQLQLLFIHEQDTRSAFVRVLEERRKESESQLSRWNDRITGMIVLGFVLNGITSLALAAYFARSINRRLAALVDNSERLSSGKELMPVQNWGDEIGRLDRVIHTVANELHEASQHEKAIVENAIDVIASLDEDCRIMEINPAAEKSWGYERSELIGKPLVDFVFADDVSEMSRSMLALRGPEEEGFFETRLVRKDGSMSNLLLSMKWLSSEQKYSCVAHDITQRKLAQALLSESEQIIRLLLESMPFGLVVTNDAGVIESTNAKLKHMLGYRESELLGSPFGMLFEENSSSFVAWQNDIENGAVITATAVAKDEKQTFPCELARCRFRMNEQEKLLITVLDVSELHEMEQLKREYMAMVNHDLRTPLTTILISLQILREGVL
ncbi:MAG: PAS domain S-box protein, partial [Cyanobacteria bacterium]|nr:PAS domain S-box protein [Cyanobacteriota bacterium]